MASDHHHEPWQMDASIHWFWALDHEPWQMDVSINNEFCSFGFG